MRRTASVCPFGGLAGRDPLLREQQEILASGTLART
jgi:hypothetical protein